MAALPLSALSLDDADEPTGASEVSKPPPMRKKPQQRWVGAGKRYATRAEFDADLAKWNEEHDARKLLVKEWDAQQDRVRDRSGRVQQSGAQHRRQQAMTEPEKDVARRERERDRYKQMVKAARERYPDIGQRVCILSGKFAGQCGAVIAKEHSGAWRHTVRLDAREDVVVPAKELEAWPAIGQKINWLPSERAPR